jgi:hypothetical protein
MHDIQYHTTDLQSVVTFLYKQSNDKVELLSGL